MKSVGGLKIGYSLFIILGIVLLFFVGIAPLYHLKEPTTLYIIKATKFFVTLSTFILISYLITSKKISNKVFLTGVIIVSFSLRFIWLKYCNTVPVSDFEDMYLMAKDLANGKNNMAQMGYFNKFPGNIPFTIFQGLLLKINDSLDFLKIFNVLLGTMSVALIYLITKHSFSIFEARIASFFAAIYPPFIIFTPVLTNQHLSMFLVILTIWLWLKNKNLIVIGVLLGFAFLIRQTALIYCIAFFIVLLIDIIKQYRLKSFKNLMLSNSKFLLGSIGFCLLFNLWVTHKNYHNEGLFYDPIPKYKFIVGLNQPTLGRYSDSIAQLTMNFITYQEIAPSLLDQQISKLNLTFIKEKFKFFWGVESSMIDWSFTPNVKNKWKNDGYKILERYFFMALVFFCIITCFVVLFKRPLHYNKVTLLMLTSLIGFVLIYAVIEIQSRYRLEIYPLFFILFAPGLNYINKQFFEN